MRFMLTPIHVIAFAGIAPGACRGDFAPDDIGLSGEGQSELPVRRFGGESSAETARV
jgi:hypothetical protein